MSFVNDAENSVLLYGITWKKSIVFLFFYSSILLCLLLFFYSSILICLLLFFYSSILLCHLLFFYSSIHLCLLLFSYSSILFCLLLFFYSSILLFFFIFFVFLYSTILLCVFFYSSILICLVPFFFVFVYSSIPLFFFYSSNLDKIVITLTDWLFALYPAVSTNCLLEHWNSFSNLKIFKSSFKWLRVEPFMLKYNKYGCKIGLSGVL